MFFHVSTFCFLVSLPAAYCLLVALRYAKLYNIFKGLANFSEFIEIKTCTGTTSFLPYLNNKTTSVAANYNVIPTSLSHFSTSVLIIRK